MAISPGSTLIDQIIPRRRSRIAHFIIDALLIIGFSLFVALCAQLSFHIPTTPVPVTFQTLAVLLTGAALGSKRGGLALLLYLAEGVAGLPVFSSFSGGIVPFIGYTGGYLWAFPIAAFVTGLLCERGLDRNIITCIVAMLPGTLIIYTIGTIWFMHVTGYTLVHSLQAAVIPFLLGDLIKILIAVCVLPVAWTIVGVAHHSRERENPRL